MKRVFALLFLATPLVLAACVLYLRSFAGWFPNPAGSFATTVDARFDEILVIVAVLLFGTHLCLFWSGACLGVRRAPRAALSSSSARRLELVWTAVPAALLVFLALVQRETYAQMKQPAGLAAFSDEGYSAEHPLLHLFASQFSWEARYSDREGRVSAAGCFELRGEIVVPADTDVVLLLESRDVLHSFFVPALRLKQDALPGRAIPVWFRAERPGRYDLICAELCGPGHYSMAGSLRVLERADFEAWLAEQRAALYRGSDEAAPLREAGR